MQVEIHELDLRYRDLRIIDVGRQSRLAASLAREGQRHPALVVAGDEGDQGRYVLIDGYRRVEALAGLGRDVVDIVVLPVAEAEALVLGWRLETSRRRSALEDAWLLDELVGTHGMGLTDLAGQLRRSKSWISRRLGLARALPPEAQLAVKRGIVPPHAAMKYLVPLARANTDHCRRLVTGLGDISVSDRQVAALYVGWKTGDDEQRERIVDHPHLFLKAGEAAAEPEIDTNEAVLLTSDLEGISGLCRRARKRVREGAFTRANAKSRLTTTRTWQETRLSFEGLVELMNAEARDAGPRHPNGDPAAAS